jgi:hypothetical protein
MVIIFGSAVIIKHLSDTIHIYIYIYNTFFSDENKKIIKYLPIDQQSIIMKCEVFVFIFNDISFIFRFVWPK